MSPSTSTRDFNRRMAVLFYKKRGTKNPRIKGFEPQQKGGKYAGRRQAILSGGEAVPQHPPEI